MNTSSSCHSCVSWLPLIARILIAVPFLMAAFNKITNFAGTAEFAASAGLPAPDVAIVIAILVEIVGGLSVLLGYRIFWGAIALAVFTVVASFVFHADFADQAQQLFFMKNMGIVAALLYMAHYGAGKGSLDKKEEPTTVA